MLQLSNTNSPFTRATRFEQLESRLLLTAVNAGGPAIGLFAASSGFVGGGNYTSSTPVSVAGVMDAAPTTVYQTERTGQGGGDFNYSQAGLVPGNAYDVRLHFAEIYWSESGKRSFDVLINSTKVLDDYDVFVEAGGEDQAVIEEFTATATGSGRIDFEFLTEADNAKVSAIEVIGETQGGGERVLFVRGGDRTGGFLEANNDAGRTEQLADINNFETNGGNHGWGTLATTLQSAGMTVEQITEGVENSSGPANGIHIDFESVNLAQYDAVVLGSNNAVYDTAAIDAVEQYIRTGGAVLFISDANFGGNWADAPNSDQQFLDRFGWTMNQDQGTYAVSRSAGEFDVPDHPIFDGVNTFDGEGVSPIVLGTPGTGVTEALLANAEGSTRVNTPPFGSNQQGNSRSVTANDAALTIAYVDQGRIAGHFDRNTFFNQNGAGTSIVRFDNSTYAVNLFSWLVGRFEPNADFDNSSTVDGFDFLTWQIGFGATSGAVHSEGDANLDGAVNGQDLTGWYEQYGESNSAVAAAQLAPGDLIALAARAAAESTTEDADTATDMCFDQLGSGFAA
ncbi:malectin domain-containing carbohydrate-binding protein [Adhaeretor mobilis]|uniref:Di-glucose binding within endoplasmic reticulum n=1 Tax=Adhaeretor mobilis TaxID=1930276 RepID=A0A517MTA1_9BACT|nr:malectin domain-containing carbohydrate-binding protein [Adhaeretor mobilis]QDS98108.1 Di-glucose binding within endoplasmic reticulum [Adhaeretor mobilis]